MEQDLAAFRIGELSQRTGVAVATLRAWESRYRLLRPSRTAGGQRLYSAADEARIREVQRLVAQGTALGAAARWVADNQRQAGSSQTFQTSQTSQTSQTALTGSATMASRSTRPAPDEHTPVWGRSDRLGLALATNPQAAQLSARSGQDEMLVAAHETTRAMIHATTPADVVAVLAGFVRQAGGAFVDAQIDDAVLPVDLSFGEGPPMLPWAEPMSVARMTLEQALPSLIEDARRLIDLLRRAQSQGLST